MSLGLKKSLSISAHPITIVQYNIQQYCAKDFYDNHVKFPCPFSIFHSSSLLVDLTSCIGVDNLFFNICFKIQGHLYPLCVVDDFKPQTLCYSSTLFLSILLAYYKQLLVNRCLETPFFVGCICVSHCDILKPRTTQSP